MADGDVRVAVLTAAGSGMGADAARRLADLGWKVAILSSSGRGEALANELGGFGVTGSNLDPAALKRLVDGTMERWGRIDALINSAGHGPKGELLAISDEDWQQGFEVYFLNVVRPARLVTPITVSRVAARSSPSRARPPSSPTRISRPRRWRVPGSRASRSSSPTGMRATVCA